MSHALSELTAGAMNEDANIYPTGIPGVPDRCSNRYHIGDHTSWQPAGEQDAHKAFAMLLNADNESNTMRIDELTAIAPSLGCLFAHDNVHLNVRTNAMLNTSWYSLLDVLGHAR